ncbi:synaptonemal complex protein 2 isoform X2 [Centropristis striata]|uniref:synaptonemal complex protein 2 isoform X2 n=1 Tax=Centropristis striata TaxID=184440 RepID=UPI0027E066A8|nr:synaptonemal complex protein 2 isoform X2 [Centropristis striata]
MAPGQDARLEKVIDEVLKIGDVHKLEVFLQSGKYEGSPVKCSPQFLNKLDKLVSRSLDKKTDTRSASLGFTILHKCGKHLKLPGGCQGLSGIISQGLLKKMVQWFEKCRQLWIQCGPHWDETMFNLSEDFFDALMVVHDACKEGTNTVTESFLYPVGQLAVDPRVHILIQKEAVRKFNLILDKIPVELKKERKLLTSQEASDIMIKLAGQILKGGDYDLQTALMEALCRMATPNQRKELADRWFSMEHVASAFVRIRDSEFETDCRKFLNLVNGMQGDKRRVFSYPCLEAYLDKHELLMPADEKLEQFWIDFNLDSHSISFYFSLPDEDAQEGQWETICINENEVQSYTVTDEGKRKVLRLTLSEVVIVGEAEGSSLTIHFSPSLDILQAAHTVYGHSKDKGFVGKTSTSVVKTTVQIIMENNSSQVVPESQMSISQSEENTAPYPLPAAAAPVQMVTPFKTRISESTTFISGSGGGRVHSAGSLSAVMSTNTSAKSKGKPPLEMVRSCDRQEEFCLGELRTTAKSCSNGTTPKSTVAGGMTKQSSTSLQSKASKLPDKSKIDKQKKGTAVAKTGFVPTGQGGEQSLEPTFVPDTQPRTGGNITLNWSKLSVSEMLMMPTQKINSLSRPEFCSSLAQQQEQPSSAQRSSSSVSQKQLHIELTQRLQQVLNERNQDPAPLQPSEPQIKMSVSKDSKGKSSVDRSASTLCTPKVQQTQRNGQAKGKRKSQMSAGADAAPIKAPAKASTTKALQKKTQLNVIGDNNRALSSKQKRDTEVAGSMVKLISSRYEMNTQPTVKHTAKMIPKSCIPPLVNRPVFNMSWFSTYQRDVSGAIVKSHSKTATNSTRQRKDVYAFNTDEPYAGGKNKTLNNTSTISSSGTHDSSGFFSTNKKGPPVTKDKRHVRKHLFSDTDADCGMTDVSWLRESSRKPKPRVTTYSRQAPVKPKALSPHTSYESPDLPPNTQKPVKHNDKLSKKPELKGRAEQPNKTVNPAAAPSRPHAAGRRLRRTAATCTKSYREPDTDDSQSESEKSPVPKNSSTNHLENADKAHKAAQVTKKKAASKHVTKISTKLESDRQSSQSESDSGPEQPATSKVVCQQNYFGGQKGRSEKTRVDVPVVEKRKKTSTEKSTDTYRSLDCNNQSDLKKPSGLKQQRPENIIPKPSKLNKKDVIPAKEQTNGLKDSWAARETSFCRSPPFIERMRSAERSAPTLGLTCSPLLSPRGSPLPASPSPPCKDTPSPILLLPKPCSTVSSKGHLRPSSFYSAEKKRNSAKNFSPSLPSLTPICRTPAPSAPTGKSALETSPVQLQLTSAAQSPLSLSTRPLFTSTLLNPSVPSPPQSPLPEDIVNHGSHFYSKVSSVSWVSLSQSSVISNRVGDSPTAALAVSLKKEKTPSSEQDIKSDQLLISGPSRKRHISSFSDSEEDEKEERKKCKMRGQRSPRMKPRKLFKSSTKPHGQAESCGEQSSLEEEEIKESRAKDRSLKVKKKGITGGYQNIKNKTLKDAPRATVVKVSAAREVSCVASSSNTMSSSHWEAEVEDEDMDADEDFRLPKLAVNPNNLCQQFSSELKKKFQNRSNMVEVYNKQTLKTMQQHVSSLNKQVMKHRTQRLEQVQKVLLEETRKLEQNDAVLKNMEKDMTMFWKKQSVAFHSYHEQETMSNEALKKALQSNVCHSLEYEERIFISQMCLIRNDMKSIQDRLLSQMQEGEIQSVKRSLHALFFP